MPKYFLTDSKTTMKKSQKPTLFFLKMVKNQPRKWPKSTKIANNYDFRGHMSNSIAEKIPKNEPSKSKMNDLTHSWITLKQQWKSPENNYFDTQNGHKTGITFDKKGPILGPFSWYNL